MEYAGATQESVRRGGKKERERRTWTSSFCVTPAGVSLQHLGLFGNTAPGGRRRVIVAVLGGGVVLLVQKRVL